MPLFRPAIIFLSIFVVTVALFSSCTITQRRYRTGFHLEWKHRFKGYESVQANALKNNPVIAESASIDTLTQSSVSIRPVEVVTVSTNTGRVSEPESVTGGVRYKAVAAQGLIKQRSKLNREIKTSTVVNKNFQKKRSDKSGGVVLLGILFSLAVLIIPPILFSVAAYWIDLSGVGLAFVWIIWAAGIVAALLLFSGLWPIILSCLIWNVVFTITTLIIVLINS